MLCGEVINKLGRVMNGPDGDELALAGGCAWPAGGVNAPQTGT